MVKSRRSRRDTAVEVASGVDALIARLRDEGVAVATRNKNHSDPQ